MPSIPSTHDEVLAWLQHSWEIHDSLDVTKFDDVYSKGAQLKFANHPVAEGIDAIRQVFAPNFPSLSYMKHTTRQADKVGDNHIWLSAEITYRAKGDPENREINIPAAGHVTLVTEGEEAGKIAQMEVFLDHAPILERLAAAAKWNT
ncbi:hypothetical protein CCHL11_03542 [Colletotrichum chlorophyti]|uniref:SnoaL-like domain-containing protein n=1 Tax=Colletotrichum chlorophyti TaxID=708187 RepID=A0A1Q8RSB5_9PEZI|nr:hypothetical protein CCHL11_03542 [Colletotrichum chlorophyti]